MAIRKALTMYWKRRGPYFPEIIYLDNRQLDDFLEGFKKRDCLSLYCGDCRTPETSKEEVKDFLKSKDLFKYVERA